MIDSKFQGQGIGRAGLILVMDEIRLLRGIESMLICYMPSNPVAKGFYYSLGFIETGIDISWRNVGGNQDRYESLGINTDKVRCIY
ncbi:MAG: ribosomal protein S18 acetylase RimI-like enzyme [Candidatus Azotimanducaceae bacterium]|jgi:ribosomal protein S18 acetylase RimI-like enzyme